MESALDKDLDEATPPRVANRPLVAVAIATGLIAIYLARNPLLFVCGAFVLNCMLSPLVRKLVDWRIPRVLAACLVLVGFLALLGGVSTRLVTPVLVWLESPPAEFARLGEFVADLKAHMSEMDKASEALNEDDKRGNVVVDLAEPSVAELVIGQAPGVIGIFAAMLILLYFLLAYSGILLLKLVEVSPRLHEKKRVVEVARDIESDASRYLLTISVINFFLGVAVGGALFALGFKNALLWGVVAMVLNYVPYVGAIVGVTLLTTISLINYEDVPTALMFPAIYATLTILEGNFITPTILGRTFSINPIFILLGLLFFGWLWGPAGTLLAVPLLVIIKSALAQTSYRNLAEVMGR